MAGAGGCNYREQGVIAQSRGRRVPHPVQAGSGAGAGTNWTFVTSDGPLLGPYHLGMPTKDEVAQKGSETRRWRRYHLLVPVRVTIEKFLDVSVIDSLSFQMNDGGLEVCTDTALTIGDKADLEFKPPHFDCALTLRGVVRSNKGNFYGLEFLATSATERDQLACYREILRTKTGCTDA